MVDPADHGDVEIAARSGSKTVIKEYDATAKAALVQQLELAVDAGG